VNAWFFATLPLMVAVGGTPTVPASSLECPSKDSLAVLEQYPSQWKGNYRLPLTSEWHAACRSNDPQCQTDCRIAVTGDFDGDGATDYVFTLLQRKGSAARIAAVMSSRPNHKHWIWVLDQEDTLSDSLLVAEPRTTGGGHTLDIGDFTCGWWSGRPRPGFTCIGPPRRH
jgi:hypothetical protein